MKNQIKISFNFTQKECLRINKLVSDLLQRYKSVYRRATETKVNPKYKDQWEQPLKEICFSLRVPVEKHNEKTTLVWTAVSSCSNLCCRGLLMSDFLPFDLNMQPWRARPAFPCMHCTCTHSNSIPLHKLLLKVSWLWDTSKVMASKSPKDNSIWCHIL